MLFSLFFPYFCLDSLMLLQFNLDGRSNNKILWPVVHDLCLKFIICYSNFSVLHYNPCKPLNIVFDFFFLKNCFDLSSDQLLIWWQSKWKLHVGFSTENLPLVGDFKYWIKWKTGYVIIPAPGNLATTTKITIITIWSFEVILYNLKEILIKELQKFEFHKFPEN